MNSHQISWILEGRGKSVGRERAGRLCKLSLHLLIVVGSFPPKLLVHAGGVIDNF